MKKILLFFLASLTLVGCSWDDPSTKLIEALKREALEKQEQNVQPGIEFYSEFDAAPVVPGESDETPIYFNSNMGWKAEATSSWFSISPKEGKPGAGSVVIKAEANEEFDTRSGKITFTSGYRTFTITVVQSPKSAIILENDSFEVGKDGGTITVVVKTTVEFEHVVPRECQEWIGVEPYTKSLETRYVQLNIAENKGPERTGHVYLVNQEKGLSAKVTVSQEAGLKDVEWTKTLIDESESDPEWREWATIYGLLNGSLENKDKTGCGNAEKIEIITRASEEEMAKAESGVNLDENGELLAYYDSGENVIRIVTRAETIVMPESCYYLFGDFYSFNHLKEIVGLEKMDFSKVENFNYMFASQYALTTLDISSMDTRNALYMSSMFYEFPLEELNFGAGFITDHVVNMNAMFYRCSSLESVDLSSFNTAKVQNMNSMFSGCSSLASLALSSFNTANVQDMGYMFYGCSSLASLALSSFNTANVQNMAYMFYDCSSLESLDLSSFNTAKVQKMSEMFEDCSSLKSLDLSNFNNANVQNMNDMFKSCSSLESLDLSRFNTAKVQNMSEMFEDCSSLKSLDLSSFNTENVQNMHCMFEGCSSLESLNLSRFNTASVQDMDYMFYDCSSLESLEVSEYFDILPTCREMFSRVAYYDGTQHDFDVICNGIGEDQKASFRIAWLNSYYNCYNLLFNGVREWNWQKDATETMGEGSTGEWF